MLTFEYLWVFALAPLPLVVRWLLPPRRRDAAMIRVPFGDRLAQALGHNGDPAAVKRSAGSLVLPTLLWVLALTATARPQWIEPPLTREIPTRDLLLLVDLSGSMDQKDFKNAAGKEVDRLTAVKEVLGDFLERRKGDRVGLVVFGDAPYLQAPFSTDLDLSRELLDECEVGMAGPRTALGDAIGLGVGLFDDSDVPAKTIIALTDGNDTKSRVPPVEAARVASQRGIRIHTVAIGDPTTAGEDKLDAQALKDVASAADGKYFFAADRDGLQGIYDELDKIETHQVKTVSHRPRRELFYAPLAVGLVVSLLTAVASSLKKVWTTPAQPTESIRVNPITGELEVAA